MTKVPFTADIARWLRADAVDVARVEPAGGARRGVGETARDLAAQGLIAGLMRWRAELDRRRALALGRRWLLAALAVAVVIEFVGLAGGASTGARAPWLIAPALLWPVGVVVELRRGRPGVGDVARLLDHDLGLAEVVSTALELETDAASGSDSSPAGGLPALVRAEGSTAVARSLRSARLAPGSRWAERAPAVVLVAVLALVTVLPLIGSGAMNRGGVRRHGAAVTTRGAGAEGASPSGSAPTVRSGAGHSRATAPPTPTLQPRTGATNRPGYGAVRAPNGGNGQLAHGASTGKPTEGPPSRALAQAARGEVGARGSAGAGQRGAGTTPGAGTPSAAVGQQASGTRHAPGLSPPGIRGSGAGRAAPGTQSGRTGASTPRKAASKVPGSPGATRGGHGAPGGETAGNARGTNVPGARQGAPRPEGAGARLPIQTGYGAAAGKSAKAGNGPVLAGGRGPARSATIGGGGSASGARFPYIPPTPGLPPSRDGGLVQGYFDPFSQLLSAPWQ